MIILGIETSCDETAAAVVEDGTKIISNVVASSAAMHAKYGGIIPDQAAREQLKSIIPVIKEALTQSSILGSQLSDPSLSVVSLPETEKLKTGKQKSENRKLKTDNWVPNIDAIAVTVGPGLIGSLLVGVETAKTLAYAWNKPIIPVNHLIGHIYGNFILSEVEGSCLPEFPALVLLVSGGHTELILMQNHGKFKLLGSTRDDAAGECFDKCGRLLDLPYPYGPYIEKLAEKYNGKIKITLPRPMSNSQNLDLSFSGLKTAFLYEFKKHVSPVSEEFKAALAFELQSAIVEVLVKKFLLATKKYPVKSFILAGGVAANKHLREKMKFEIRNSKFEIEFYVPDIKLCTDNAAYIASAAFFNYKPVPWQKINADPGLDI